jgi:hypothetical protein
MKKLCAALGLSALALLLVTGGNDAGDKDKKDEKPAYKISEVMQKAMKGGLCGKVASGKASDAEKKELAAFFVALHANTPPKGDVESWKAKTAALKSAAEGVLKGEKGAEAALKKAANCAGCHSLHKG